MMSVETICVCGAGTMGAGIAQVVAMHGFKTTLYDVGNAALQRGKATIESGITRLVQRGKLNTAQAAAIQTNLHYTTDVAACKAHLVIEAIVEKQAAKVQLFEQLAAINPADTILATNTSSLSVAGIARAIAYPQRVVGLHFFNPPYLMQLVEVVTTQFTAPAVVQQMVQLVQQLGKTAVVCNDAPGFIVNRVARHYYLEALHLVEEHGADPATIDTVMEATGFKMGPFKLMDLIGLDINYAASCSVYEALGQPARLKPSVLQQQMVQANKLGRKTGEGFYTYPPATNDTTT